MSFTRNAIDFESQNWTSQVQNASQKAANGLIGQQREDGHWCFQLEADCTIPAEYILMQHYLAEESKPLQAKMATYLRRHQMADGGWPQYTGGSMDLSCTVKAYYALKLAGDHQDLPHMRLARQVILQHGGAARTNIFTHIVLALFGQMPWRGVPYMPVEFMLLPRWFPFQLNKMAYWSRTVVVPLLILCSQKAQAINPSGVGIAELYTVPPEQEKHYFAVRSLLNRLFIWGDWLARRCDWLMPKFFRRRATRKAEQWCLERLNGEDGLGAIFPAMVNLVLALHQLGYDPNHPQFQQARQAVDKLIHEEQDWAYCQPCLSPVWDTVLAAHALQTLDQPQAKQAAQQGLDWLVPRQLTDQPGDWQEKFADLPGGGWPFQYGNDYYPDLDDTAAIGWAMALHDFGRYQTTIERASHWLIGLQSKNGGFAAFDADNTYYYLNHIPFADHGALLDPPTEDVSARVVAFLASLPQRSAHQQQVMDRCLQYLYQQQQDDGAWYGRWGTNYLYGTWTVLAGLGLAGVSANHPAIKKATDFLLIHQRDDGGWGEHNDGYIDAKLAFDIDHSTPFHTAWALLGLMAAGVGDTPAIRRGIAYLISQQQTDGLWCSDDFTAPGFPRVFYLKYHGYSKYFPLWAIADYQRRFYGVVGDSSLATQRQGKLATQPI